MLVMRRSHAKSKNGCRTCIKRRVKCDEHRPSWQDLTLLRGSSSADFLSLACVQASRRCDYPETNALSKKQSMALLAWPDGIERACREWKRTGNPLLPSYGIDPSPDWHRLPLSSLRYLHYLLLVGTVLDGSNARRFCIWWNEFPL